jgi:superfamily II DNA or RNA helicase
MQTMGKHRSASAKSCASPLAAQQSRRFTKRQRTELWLASHGYCTICGKQLGSSYQIDHLHPWSKGGLTINENGQPVHSACNQRKAANMLRSHQQEFLEDCRRIKASQSLRKVIALVVPGGGKSALPVIAAHELIPYIGDGLAWIVPRTNLRTQAETAFTDGWLRSIIGHKNEIRGSTNESDLLRGKIGYSTTYQALLAANTYRPNPHVALFERRRMILVLDEPQHVALDGEFCAVVRPLVERCCLLILMSGCLDRHDNKRLAYLDYLVPDDKGRAFIDLSESEQQIIVRYGLADATREHAIIKINFELRDCSADWEIEDADGNVITEEGIESFDEASKIQTGKALFAALSTEYSEDLLCEAANYWRDRQKHNPRSLFLVVVASIGKAELALKFLQKMGIDADIATSEQTDAHLTIERFRHKEKPYLKAIVTVAMAYEGMDAPAADVLCCLTHIRSKEWIEQMIHRVTRNDRNNPLPWEHQFATIFAPKDKFFLDIMAKIKAEQAPFVRDSVPLPPPPPPPSGNKMRAVQSELTSASAHTFDTAAIMADEHHQLNEALKVAEIHGAISTTAAQRFFEAMKAERVKPQINEATNVEDVVPPTKREKKLREQIVRLQRAGYRRNDPETAERIERRGKAIWQIFQKRLEELTEEQLQSVWNNRKYWMVE